MIWYVYTNTSPSFNETATDVGCELTNDGGNTSFFMLPYHSYAQDDQSIRLIANLLNGSKLEIREYDGSTTTVIRTLVNSASLHFMYDGTNNKWRIVSDEKIKAIEDEDHNLTALSGNKIKDDNGDLIDQSGVNVVGIASINGKTPVLSEGGDISIASINGKTPLFTCDTLDADTVDGKTPVFSNDDVTLGDVMLGDVSCDSLSVNNEHITKRVEVDNTVTGSFYDAVEEYYGLPSAGEMKECLIKGAEYRSEYYRSVTYTAIFFSGSYYHLLGHISYFGLSAGFGQTIPVFNAGTNPSTSFFSKHYFYV